MQSNSNAARETHYLLYRPHNAFLTERLACCAKTNHIVLVALPLQLLVRYTALPVGSHVRHPRRRHDSESVGWIHPHHVKACIA